MILGLVNKILVPGRGTVLSVDADLNPEYRDIKIGDKVIADTSLWEVVGIESSTKLTYPPRPGSHLGFVVKELANYKSEDSNER